MSDDSKNDVTVRRATPWDVHAICRLLDECYRTSEVAYPPINEYKLFRWVLDTVAGGLALVADIGHGRIIGSVGMAPFQLPWTDQQAITDEWVYVLPAFRDRGATAQLFKMVEAEAEKYRLPIFMGITHGDEGGRKQKFFERRGYQHIGGNFVRWCSGDEPVQQQPEDGVQQPEEDTAVA